MITAPWTNFGTLVDRAADLDQTALIDLRKPIHQACVVPVPDDVRRQMPVAFVVPRSGAQLDAHAVKAWALEHGPAYQHPRLVELVAELPRAGTEKIDRAALVARAIALTGGSRS